MIRFFMHRTVLALATLWALSLITFLLGPLVPGGPATVTSLAATVFIAVNLLVDLLYGFLDPRLRSAAAAD